MVTLLGILFFWILYMSIEGWREGMYFHYLDKSGGKCTYEHDLWTVQRSIVGIFFVLLSLFCVSHLYQSVIFGFTMILASSFFHDGFYYVSRHELNNFKYPKGFFDQSTTSTAMLTKYCTPILRTIYFILSIIIIIIFL